MIAAAVLSSPFASVAMTWVPAGAERIAVYLAADGPDPRDDDEESFQGITQDWIS
jgi:hypothetical protein